MMRLTRDNLTELPPRQPRPARRGRGYVLLSTVAVLVLAVVVLTGVTRHSLSRIVLANCAQDELQLKWGAVSCNQALLPHAKQIMEAEDALRTQPGPSTREQVQLGKYRYTLVVADEAAKADANAMLRSGRHRWEVEQYIREALRGSGVGNHVRLAVPLHENPSPIGSFAQMLPEVAPARLLEQKQGSVAPADVLTCWSDGKINIFRASEPALQAALASKLTGVQISDLLRARAKLFEQRAPAQAVTSAAPASQPSDGTVDPATPAGRSQALARITASLQAGADGSSAQQLLAHSSTCYSVWVLADGGKVQKSELTIMEAADPRHPKYWSFAW